VRTAGFIAVNTLLLIALLFLGASWHAERVDLRRLRRSAGIALGTALVVSTPFWLPIWRFGGVGVMYADRAGRPAVDPAIGLLSQV
jgi:hypothetical protein